MYNQTVLYSQSQMSIHSDGSFYFINVNLSKITVSVSHRMCIYGLRALLLSCKPHPLIFSMLKGVAGKTFNGHIDCKINDGISCEQTHFSKIHKSKIYVSCVFWSCHVWMAENIQAVRVVTDRLLQFPPLHMDMGFNNEELRKPFTFEFSSLWVLL